MGPGIRVDIPGIAGGGRRSLTPDAVTAGEPPARPTGASPDNRRRRTAEDSLRPRTATVRKAGSVTVGA